MAWDASTGSAVAALLVAFVALIVTSAQAVQQYLASGQLIRICDSVVYGKMPGQGRRIWEFSQFRFRVVYSIPQISLPASLWSAIPSTLPDEEGDLTLPDLQTSTTQNKPGLKQIIMKQFEIQMGRSRDLVCGEASWVSFCRAIQHSGGNSLRYEMVEGDADRCPTDLPVVPMQLSMRDVVTLATMSGMECTDISYQQQSLSMQGSAGTITSSRHPILGSLIHFAPKLPHEKHGFRINHGSVNPQWVARMRDILTVAGEQYDKRDRKLFEEDEGQWVTISDDRSVVKYQEKSVRKQFSIIGEMRKRRGTRGNQASQSGESIPTNQMGMQPTEVVAQEVNDPIDFSMRRPQDGEWSWLFLSERPGDEEASASHGTRYLPSSGSTPPPQVFPSRKWYDKLNSFSYRRLSAAIGLPRSAKKPNVLPMSEPFEKSIQKVQPEAKIVSKPSNTKINISTFSSAAPARMRSKPSGPVEEDLRVETFKNKVQPRPRVINDESHDYSQHTPPLLLLRNKETTKSQDSSTPASNAWYTKEEQKLIAARAEQIGRKWQSIVKRRQEDRARKSRKEQDWLLRKSEPQQIDKFTRKEPQQTSASLALHTFSRSNQSESKSDPSSPSLLRLRHQKEKSISSPENIETKKPIPAGARWTKIDRRLVNSQALEEAQERFEERDEFIVVFRVLTREEIELYALRTLEIREARNKQQSQYSFPQLSDSSDTSRLSEGSKNSFDKFPYDALRRETSNKDDSAASHNSDQVLDEKDSGPSNLVENPSTDLKSKGLGETGSSEQPGSFSNDTAYYRTSTGDADLNEKNLLRKNSLPDNPDNLSPLEQQDDFEETHVKEINRGKSHSKRVEHGTRRRSSAHTDSSNTFKDELLYISSDSILKKARERIKQCKDIPVALEYFLKSQADPRYSTAQVIAIHDQLKHTSIMMKKILVIGKNAHERRNLDRKTVSDLEFLVANLGKCLDVLESDFELYEITHMDGEAQRKTWDKMLVIFERQTSNSLIDHLQVTCSFGNALLESLRAGRGPSHDSEELKAILLEMNQMQPESSLSTLPKREPSFKESLRRPRRTYHYPYKSNSVSSSETESLRSRQRERLRSKHDKNNQGQGVFRAPLAGGEQVSPTGAVNWLWICQADIIPGYLATPWKGFFSEAVCIGGVSTILKGLDALTDSSTRQYVDRTQRHCEDWIRAGKATYPSYALNAKGGIVVSGLYKPVLFAGFPQHLPPIELLHSYDHQVRRGVRYQHQALSAIVDDLAELMGLDTWLSLCGRTAPIFDGPSNLLRTLPALSQRVLSDFEFEFANLDRTTSTDGGFQLIQTVAESLIAALVEQNLSEPELLFAMVAFLRAVKTALCVVRGSDTAKLCDVLEHDLQVYLA